MNPSEARFDRNNQPYDLSREKASGAHGTLAGAVSAALGVELIEDAAVISARIATSPAQPIALRELPDLPEDYELPPGVHALSIERKQVEFGAGGARCTVWLVTSEAGSTTAAAPSPGAPDFAARARFLESAGLSLSTAEDAFAEALAEADMDGRMADHGIGAYEYWGARGHHTDMQFELENESGELDLELASAECPLLPERLTGSRKFFVCTKSSYSAKDDEYFDDGYDVELDFTGELQSVKLVREMLEREGAALPYWRVFAKYTWEQR